MEIQHRRVSHGLANFAAERPRQEVLVLYGYFRLLWDVVGCAMTV